MGRPGARQIGRHTDTATDSIHSSKFVQVMTARSGFIGCQDAAPVVPETVSATSGRSDQDRRGALANGEWTATVSTRRSVDAKWRGNRDAGYLLGALLLTWRPELGHRTVSRRRR
ncbi:hypothetical protein [Nocardia sp. NPDC057455]|uniref:hypothetical protein n=1 Tax=Nocardia sp. NPDC057455 TaxID=3346138 RepID=UPI00366BCCD6